MGNANFGLHGKVAVVTGAIRGLGQYFSRALAGAGADLVITSRSLDSLKEFTAEIEGMGRRVLPLALDIRDFDSIRGMGAQRSGHIIHLCSNGSRLSLYGSYAYNASKHSLEGIVKTAAAQLAPFGVRVNAIAPGTVETQLNRSLLRTESGELRPRARSILAHTPSKKFCTRNGVTASLLSMCIPHSPILPGTYCLPTTATT